MHKIRYVDVEVSKAEGRRSEGGDWASVLEWVLALRFGSRKKQGLGTALGDVLSWCNFLGAKSQA
jgi:hypothetical protein